jgi:serine/threonine-protein kinase HipA
MNAIKRITANANANANDDLEQQFLRTASNIIARNQDDHVKNIAFLMDASGKWRFSPAFDLIYAWNPNGSFTGRHQMSVNEKRYIFKLDDFLSFNRTAGIKPMKAKALIDQVTESVKRRPELAGEAGVVK